jgi:hypothetical protein
VNILNIGNISDFFLRTSNDESVASKKAYLTISPSWNGFLCFSSMQLTRNYEIVAAFGFELGLVKIDRWAAS